MRDVYANKMWRDLAKAFSQLLLILFVVAFCLIGTLCFVSCSGRICEDRPMLTSETMKFSRVSTGPIMSLIELGQTRFAIASSSKEAKLETSDEVYQLNFAKMFELTDRDFDPQRKMSLPPFCDLAIEGGFLYTVNKNLVHRVRIASDEVIIIEVPTTSSLQLVCIRNDTAIASDARGVLWNISFDSMESSLLCDAGAWIYQLAFLSDNMFCYTRESTRDPQFVVARKVGNVVTTYSMSVSGTRFKQVGPEEVWILLKDKIMSVNLASYDTRTIMNVDYEVASRAFDVSDDLQWIVWGDADFVAIANVPEQRAIIKRVADKDCYNRVTSVKLINDKLLVGFYNGWLGISDIKMLFKE